MSSKANWVLHTDHSVYKFLAKIPEADAEHILDRIFFEIVTQESTARVYEVKRRTSNTY